MISIVGDLPGRTDSRSPMVANSQTVTTSPGKIAVCNLKIQSFFYSDTYANDKIVTKVATLKPAWKVPTAVVTPHIAIPEQELVLVGSGDHGDYENIFFIKILPAP